MKNQNVSKTVNLNLCISCGVCKGICPTGCILMKKKNGMFFPEIQSDLCSECGLCLKACPGKQVKFSDGISPIDAIKGSYKLSVNAWSCDEQVRFCSASGGVVTSIVDHLLKRGDYESAFLVDSYEYSGLLKSNRVTYSDLKSDATHSIYPKSRYLPVSHEKTVEYLKKNCNERVIIVATPCALRGILNVIHLFHLDRKNYLLVGLFCDKVFNYNVYDYYLERFSSGKQVKAIHFKNKESGGWPGDMKFSYLDGSYSYQSITERMRAKPYFYPERCLYCIDKLNVAADISIGDNYTEKERSQLGSNSVIIRTEIGKEVFDALEDAIDYVDIDFEEIAKAQDINWRANNFYYSQIFQCEHHLKMNEAINLGVIQERYCYEYYQRYLRLNKERKIGENYNEKSLSKLTVSKNADDNTSLIKRFYYMLMRRIKRRLTVKYLQ